jgi:ubiquinone/menaquinone biosynthesis C-methylase UbiE
MERSLPAEDLAWTGERLVTTCHRPLVYEHLHRYAVAFGLAKGKRVLDIACGEGYGANLLALVASKVIGVDLDAGTIAHAKTKYQRRNLHFAEGSCTEIPCEDQSIDLVASFETIEHISEHDAFLSEIKRVLAPGGILVISSPHKAEYRKVSEEANPFHEAELDHDEFVQLITKRFKHCVAAKQRLVIGSWIAPDEPSAQVSTATFRGWFDRINIESGVYRGLYSLAVCSDQALPVFDLGMFENLPDSADTWNLLDTYDTPAQISARLIDLARAEAEKAKLVLQLQGESEKKSRQLAELQKELEERSKHVAQLQRETGEQARHAAEEGSRHAAELQRLTEQQSQHLERLKSQSEIANDRLTRANNELLDARWEALTLRGTLLRKTESAETPFSRILELENRVETTTSERDHLRTMLAALQTDLERERLAGQGRQGELRATQDQLRATQDQLDATQGQLKALAKDLRSEQKQMDRLRASMSRKLILPFGKSQRKLQQLTASRRADD